MAADRGEATGSGAEHQARFRPCCRLHAGGGPPRAETSRQQDEDRGTGVKTGSVPGRHRGGGGKNVIKMDKAVPGQEGLENQDKATPNPHSEAARVRGDGAREENLSRQGLRSAPKRRAKVKSH